MIYNIDNYNAYNIKYLDQWAPYNILYANIFNLIPPFMWIINNVPLITIYFVVLVY